MLTKHRLHLVTLGESDFPRIIEVDHIRVPVMIAILAEQRGIRGHFHDISVMLHITERNPLPKRGLIHYCHLQHTRPDTPSEPYGRNDRAILMIDKPSWLLIVALIYRINPFFILLLQSSSPRYSRKMDNGMDPTVPTTSFVLLLESLADHQIALFEIGGNQIFISDTYHLEIERSRMSGNRSHLCPTSMWQDHHSPTLPGREHPAHTLAFLPLGFRPAVSHAAH